MDIISADINMRAKIISDFFGVYILLPQLYRDIRTDGNIIHIYAIEKNRKKFLLSRYRWNIPSVKNKGKITNINNIYIYVATDPSHFGLSFLIFSIK